MVDKSRLNKIFDDHESLVNQFNKVNDGLKLVIPLNRLRPNVTQLELDKVRAQFTNYQRQWTEWFNVAHAFRDRPDGIIPKPGDLDSSIYFIFETLKITNIINQDIVAIGTIGGSIRFIQSEINNQKNTNTTWLLFVVSISISILSLLLAWNANLIEFIGPFLFGAYAALVAVHYFWCELF